ncbi:developmentally regulated protein [Angomonas deanei]|uniref:Uncharacterized protein n=1 Tax=Angomonas deanei TaxID=59799 RepID=A0A7G2CSE8_9TRYP|nr:developmentally regulated protein [Angomonas deanei]CAD2221941.1 hypothetical protein, conserved [Angomonas deanei]|eukprot:EPY40778.1 developmentally regulated protein [Angomonas deanei]
MGHFGRDGVADRPLQRRRCLDRWRWGVRDGYVGGAKDVLNKECDGDEKDKVEA